MEISIDAAFDFEKYTNGAAIAGQVITGKVCSYVRGGGPLSGGNLELRISGNEVIRTTEETRCQPFFTKKILLRDLNYETLQVGYSEIPFRISLPSSLPESTCIFYNEGRPPHGCHICYEVRIVATQYKDYSSTRRFHLHAVSSNLGPPKPFLWGPTAQDVRVLGVHNAGSVALAAYLDNTRISRGSVLDVYLSCRNHSVVDIQHVMLEVVQISQISSTEGPRKEQSNVVCMLKDVDLPSLIKGKRERHEIQDKLVVASDHERMKEDLSSTHNKVRLTIPAFCRDSYQGRWSTIKHCLNIKVMSNTGVGKFITKLIPDTSNKNYTLVATIPLTIFPPLNYEAPLPTAPPQELQARQVENIIVSATENMTLVPMAEAVPLNESEHLS